MKIEESKSKKHQDPFDRLIVAQAIAQGYPVITIDKVFEKYGITRLW